MSVRAPALPLEESAQDAWVTAEHRDGERVRAVMLAATVAAGGTVGWVHFLPGAPLLLDALVWTLATAGWVVLTWGFLADRLPGHVIGLRLQGYAAFGAGLVAGALAALLG